MKTKRLYYTDCYLKEFEARVLDKQPDAKGVRVYLDRTAFYPESGGQPMDRGFLAGLPVLEVREEEDTIVHLLERAPESGAVKGEIDWARRFDHMQQHTGQHVLSAAFEKTGGYKTVSFHLGGESSTIDLDSDRLGERQIVEAEDLANHGVFENREVKIYFRPVEEARALDLRKPTAREGNVRLVEVAGLDLSACGGTHVNRTGAIGLIVVRKVERMRDTTRVEFLSGQRVLAAVRRDFKILSEAAQMFSTSADQVPTVLAKQAEELRSALRERVKSQQRLAQALARNLWVSAPEKNGRKIVCHIFAMEELEVAKKAAHEIAGQASSVALIGVKGNPASLFFSQSPGGPADVSVALRQTLAKFGGKGGGTRDFAQAGALDETKLEEALKFAASLLE